MKRHVLLQLIKPPSTGCCCTISEGTSASRSSRSSSHIMGCHQLRKSGPIHTQTRYSAAPETSYYCVAFLICLSGKRISQFLYMRLHGIATSSHGRPPLTTNRLFSFHSKLANYQSTNCCMLVIALTHYIFFLKPKAK
jgi:hypothetical protein